jgi:hypothetical protein
MSEVPSRAFISYPDALNELADLLRDELRQLGIEAWLFSRDRTTGTSTWSEIELQLKEARVVLFLVGTATASAAGQARELDFCTTLGKQAVPLVCDSLAFLDLPRTLVNVNGARLEYNNTRVEASRLARAFYPELFQPSMDVHWVCPRPGEWLKVCQLDDQLKQHFALGDVVYFRRLSPLGLFECYAPKIHDLFWFYPENLRRMSYDVVRQASVPSQYDAYRQYET